MELGIDERRDEDAMKYELNLWNKRSEISDGQRSMTWKIIIKDKATAEKTYAVSLEKSKP